MLKVTMSFALLLLVTATLGAQETAAPATATTILQETPAQVSADDIKLKPAIDVALPSAEPQKVDSQAATASSPSPSEKPGPKRAVAARQHSTATRERASLASARVGPYPGYGAGF